jgi:cytochrome b subunit of formate dehydrogenase
MPSKENDAGAKTAASATAPKELSGVSEITRFSLNFRVQHIILFTSLIVLSVTGLSLMFHENWLAALILRLEGGVETRGAIHRLAALALIGVSFYHFLYILLTETGHKEFMKLKPRGKDFGDLFQTVKFDLGKSDEEPSFGKFDYKQKFQYGGVVIGLGLMILTGLILWFETLSMAIMPKWAIDVTFVVHGYEGLWAFMVLFLWHMYNVHLNPDVFPMDWTWITGKISLEDLKEKHYLEYQDITGKQQDND